MVDYVLQTVDLDVFGGPTSLDVSTDFGRTGDRGSRIWVDTGPPEQTLTTQDIALYDLYINSNSSDQYYSWLYQYVPEIGAPVWRRVLKLNPSQYSVISLVNFDDGEGILNIPLLNITADVSPQLSQFIFRYDFESLSGFPVSSSFTYSIQTVDGPGGTTVKNLRIVFNAIEFDGSDWAALSGSYKVHSFVSYLS
jgi:hypothetical protein